MDVEKICETCGKTVTDPDGIHTCQQPPAGEFTKKTRILLGKPKARPAWDYLNEACDHLDRLEVEKKELEERTKDLISGHFCPSPQLSKMADTCDCSHSDRHRAMDWAVIDKLESQLANYKEATQHLWKLIYCAHPSAFRKRAAKVIKRILGDEDFERIIE